MCVAGPRREPPASTARNLRQWLARNARAHPGSISGRGGPFRSRYGARQKRLARCSDVALRVTRVAAATQQAKQCHAHAHAHARTQLLIVCPTQGQGRAGQRAPPSAALVLTPSMRSSGAPAGRPCRAMSARSAGQPLLRDRCGPQHCRAPCAGPAVTLGTRRDGPHLILGRAERSAGVRHAFRRLQVALGGLQSLKPRRGRLALRLHAQCRRHGSTGGRG